MKLKMIACIILASLLSPPAAVRAQGDDAVALLKAMSYVGSQQTIELSFDSDIEASPPRMQRRKQL